MRKGLVGLFVTVMLVFALASAGAVMADGLIAYEATGSNNFGTVDLNTGVYTQIGNMGLRLSGLGVANGALYGGGYYSSTLYSVNPHERSPYRRWDGEHSLRSYRFHADRVVRPRHLWCESLLINPSTGATTLIGPTGISFTDYSGFSTNSSTLYLTTLTSLYTLNTNTGAATLVGSTGAGIGALVTENGILYGGVESPLSVNTVNPATGALTFVASASGTYGNFWGLAPVNPVPLPGAIFSFAPGLVGLAADKKKVQEVGVIYRTSRAGSAHGPALRNLLLPRLTSRKHGITGKT